MADTSDRAALLASDSEDEPDPPSLPASLSAAADRRTESIGSRAYMREEDGDERGQAAAQRKSAVFDEAGDDVFTDGSAAVRVRVRVRVRACACSRAVRLLC